MKNLRVSTKTKVMAALIALTLTGAVALTTTSVVAKDSLNEEVNIVVASSRSYSESEEYSEDSRHERGERGERNYDDENRNYGDSRTTEVTLEDAIKIAIDDTPGKVMEVEFERGRYEVKIRTKDGYKKEIYISAKTGLIVKRK